MSEEARDPAMFTLWLMRQGAEREFAGNFESYLGAYHMFDGCDNDCAWEIEPPDARKGTLESVGYRPKRS